MSNIAELPEDFMICENCIHYDIEHKYCLKDEDEPVIFEPYESCYDWEWEERNGS